MLPVQGYQTRKRMRQRRLRLGVRGWRGACSPVGTFLSGRGPRGDHRRGSGKGAADPRDKEPKPDLRNWASAWDQLDASPVAQTSALSLG